MKRIFSVSILSGLMLVSAFNQELSLDQVLQHYFQATGFDKMQQLKTIRMTGTITKQTTMPLKIIKMRPAKYKMENDVADIYTCQTYDGQTAWEITTPWTGNTKPHSMKADATNEIIVKADFDGVLFHWKEKGHKAELTGKEKYNDSIVYKIRLTRNDGVIEYYFINSVSFLLVKKSRMVTSDGKEIESISTFTDFREIGGIKFPYTNENFMDGQFYSIIEYDTIEVNQRIDPAIFEMSAK